MSRKDGEAAKFDYLYDQAHDNERIRRKRERQRLSDAEEKRVERQEKWRRRAARVTATNDDRRRT